MYVCMYVCMYVSQPARQHDGAEFMQYLVERQLLRESLLVVHWTASEADSVCVDRGSSAPLLLVPPESALLNPEYHTSIQRMIDDWHEQSDMHAVLEGPRILVLQAGRFDYQQAGAVKRRFRIAAEREVMLPVFGEHLSVTQAQYQLCSVLIHWGTSPDVGHYTALLYSHTGNDVYHVDDNIQGSRVLPEKADRMCVDSYLFFYAKCQ